MKFCQECGSEVKETAAVCVQCGSYVNNNKPGNVNDDKSSLPVNLLSLCCFPLLGIIMFFVWKDQKPTAAKSALGFGIGGFALGFTMWFLGALLGSL